MRARPVSATVASCPGWLEALLSEGLAGLSALRLDGAPGKDTLHLTVDIWAMAMMVQPWVWDEARDSQRVRAAFTRLYAEADHWPPPKQLLRWLPEREPLPALPPPPSKPHPILQARMDQLATEVAATNAELAAQGLPPLTRLEIHQLALRGSKPQPGTLGAALPRLLP